MPEQEHFDIASPRPMDALWLNRRITMFPLWFFQCYLAFTVFVFAFGPWPWPVTNPVKLYLFLFFAQVALWLGYKSGIRTLPGGYNGWVGINKLIKTSLLLNFGWIIPIYMSRMGIQKLDLSRIFVAITTGFHDPAAMYAAKFEGAQKTTLLGIVTLFLYPILWLLAPLAIVYWNRLNRLLRFCFVVFVIVDLLSWVAIGTNKGIADFVLLFPWLLLAANPDVIAKMRVKKIIKILGVFLLGMILFFNYFTLGQKGRGKGSIPTVDSSTLIRLDEKNWMVSYLLPEGQGAVGAFASYLTLGYFGLSLALQESFTWSYGIGNSYYLTGLVEHFAGKGVVSDRTYAAKIEKHDWNRFGKWHTIYTWIASDVTFPGTILIIFFIGKLFAMVWLDVLCKKNPFAVALFALFIIMLFYFPANNQVLGFANTANPFWVILISWMLTRKRFVIREPSS